MSLSITSQAYTDTDFATSLKHQIKTVENAHLMTHTDPILAGVGGNPTMGYGWDLAKRGYQETLDLLALPGVGITLTADQLDVFHDYKFKQQHTFGLTSHVPTGADLIDSWTTGAHAITVDDTKASLMLDQALTIWEGNLDTALALQAPLDDSNEKIALISVFYNTASGTVKSFGAAAPRMMGLLQSEPTTAEGVIKQRFDIWWEIEFGTNKIKGVIDVEEGLQNRREGEAILFGLYSDDKSGSPPNRIPDSANHDFESLDVIQLLDAKNAASDFIKYYNDRNINASTGSPYNSALDRVNTHYEPARKALIDGYYTETLSGGASTSNVTVTVDAKGGDGAVDIQKYDNNGLTSAVDDNNLIFALEGDDVVNSGDGKDVVYGGAGADKLYGEDGDDALFGDGHGGIAATTDGMDTLDGGGGADELTGGGNSDVFIAGDGDFIIDATPDDYLKVGGVLVQGTAEWDEGAQRWIGGDFEYEFDGDDLLIHQGSLLVVVRDFSNGVLGITLNGNGHEGPGPSGPNPDPGAPPAWSDDDSIKPVRIDPLAMDLDSDGLDLVGLDESTAYFDLNDDTFSERVGWVGPSEGLLVRDLDDDENVDGVSELFGNALQTGFEALATFDSNTDGKIDSSDEDFEQLKIWRDLNQDGQSQNGEITSLGDESILEIRLESSAVMQEIRGVRVDEIGSFVRTDGSEGLTASLTLPRETLVSRWEPPINFEVSSEAAALPELKGYGVVKNLSAAMTLDEDFRAAVVDFIDLLPTADFPTVYEAFGELVTRWAGTSEIATDSRGSSVNARQLETVEAFFGTGYAEHAWWGEIVSDPSEPIFGQAVEKTYENIVRAELARFLAQSHLAYMIQNDEPLTVSAGFLAAGAALKYDPATDNLLGSIDDIAASLARNAPSDAIGASDYYASAVSALHGAFDKASLAEDLRIMRALEPHLSSFTPAEQAMIMSSASFEFRPGTSEGETLLAGPSALHTAFQGYGGDDTYIGGSDADVYLYELGRGDDQVVDIDGGQDPNFRAVDTVVMPDGVDASDVVLSLEVSDAGEASVRIEVVGESGSLLLVNQLTLDQNNPANLFANPNGIEEIRFSDGTTWDRFYIHDLFSKVAPTSGSDYVQGSAADDVLNGGGGNDYLNGRAGADAYVFDVGDGDDVIVDGSFETDSVEFASGILPGSVVVARSGDDAILSYNGGADSIRLVRQFDEGSGVDEVSFVGGPVWSGQDVKQVFLSSIETSGNDTVLAFNSDDTLEGGAGDDVLTGRKGSDTYLFASGDGDDVIVETGYEGGEGGLSFTNDQLVFASGVSHGDVTITRLGDDAILTLASSGGSIVLTNEFESLEDGVYSLAGLEYIVFDGGPTWTRQDLLDVYSAAAATTGNDAIFGGADSDVLAGGTGDDQLSGGTSADSYLWNLGDGDDVINEAPAAVADWEDEAATDELVFGVGIGPSDLTLVASGFDLIVSVAGDPGSITISDFFRSNGNERDGFGVETFTFDSAPAWSRQDIVDAYLLSAGTSGPDLVRGISGEETIEAGAGDDLVAGGAGADEYVWNLGDGSDTIDEPSTPEESPQASSTDRLTFGAGILPSDVYLERVGIDLVIGVSGDLSTITVRDHFAPANANSAGSGIEEIAFANSTVWSRMEIDTYAVSIQGTTEDDVISGTALSSTLDGGDGNDEVDGGAGDDIVYGGAGVDHLLGGDGNDVLFADASDAWLEGGDGDDEFRLEGNAVVSRDVNGGDGTDTVFYEGDQSDYAILRGDDGTPVLVGLGSESTPGDTLISVEYIAFADSVTPLALSSIQDEYGTAGNDTLAGTARLDRLFGLEGGDDLSGGDGNDFIFGGAGVDDLSGGDGDDYLEGNEGDDMLSGGDGVDQFYFSGDFDNDTVADFDVANETITLNEYAFDNVDQLFAALAQVGSDVVLTVDGARSITLESVDLEDLTSANFDFYIESHPIEGTSSNDNLAGVAEHNDIVHGYEGDDTIDAGAGNDFIDGGEGDDELTGGDGTDTFWFADEAGDDIITDFDVENDIIDLTSFSNITTYNDLRSASAQVGDDVLITLDVDNSLLVQNMTLAELSIDNIALAAA